MSDAHRTAAAWSNCSSTYNQHYHEGVQALSRHSLPHPTRATQRWDEMSKHVSVHLLQVCQQPVGCPSTAPARQHGICFLVDVDINRINSSIHIGIDIGITSDEALTWHTAAPGSLRYTLSWRLQLLDPHQASAISQLHQARSHRTVRRRSA